MTTGKALEPRYSATATPTLLPQPLISWVGDVMAEADPPPTLPGMEPAHRPRWEPPAWVPSSIKKLIPSALAQLDRALTPAPRDEIIAELTRIGFHFWADRPKSSWTVVLNDYARLLGDVPLDIFRAALDAYLLAHGGEWFPKLSQIMDHVRPLLAARQIMRRRLQDLEKAATQQAEPPRKTYAEMTPEEQAAWDRKFEQAKSTLASGGLQPVSKVAKRVTDDLLLPPGSAEPF